MSIAAPRRADIIGQYRRSEEDSGSPEVQVALLTERIRHLTEHMRTHRQDYASRRGLMVMVGRRTRLLRYLSRTNREAYQNLIKRLGLRK